LPTERVSKALIKVNEKTNVPFIAEKFSVEIENPGPTALYDQDIEILFDESLNSTKNIQVLPPYGKYTFEVTSPFSFLGGKTPNTIAVRTAGSIVRVPTSKNKVIIYSLLIFFLIVFSVIIFILYKLKGKKVVAFIKNLKTKLKSKYDRVFSKSKKDKS